MRHVGWTEATLRRVDEYIDYLREAAPQVAARAAREIFEAAERASRIPFGARPSRWPGLREVSLRRWRKILVYRVEEARVVMTALFDTRQDLTKVDPRG